MKKQSGEIRILHVEDVARDSELTRLILKKKGYDNFEFTSALSAEQGLEILGNKNFDVVVSDYGMPEMNGLEFLVELRKRGNNIPFIIFTGRGDEEVAMEALNKGANRYIVKSVDPAVLFDTLAQYIQEVVWERQKAEEREKRVKELEEMNRRLQSASKTLDRRDRKTYIDIQSFLNEHLDLIVLGLLVDKPMSGSDLIEEIYHKFGIWISSDILHFPLDKLEEKKIVERDFSKERKSFIFHIAEGMEGLFRGPTFSREMLTRFLRLAEGFKEGG